MLAFFRTLLASILGFFISIFLIFVIIAAIAKGSKKTVEVKDNSILKLKLDQPIPERTADNPLDDIPMLSENFDMPVSLKDILDAIKYAKDDSKIKGIYMETGFVQASLPTLEEIRNALIDFKKSGKFVYAYSEMYTQKNYYVSSVADSVYLNPNGIFSFAGFHSESIFFKGLLDKLDIKPILIRATGNKYKSAGETFIREDMSDAARQQTTDFMNSMYDDFLSKISAARKVPAEDLRNIANNLEIKFPEDAVKYKLVDRTVYKDEVLASMTRKLGEKTDKDIHKVSIRDYVKAENPEKSSGGNRIALIYAVGDIVGGEGSEDKMGSDKLSEAIREAREDDKVKAIVLRVNSPGGSALASDIIWREVMLAKQKKPVIASFGDVAASGGYYIAAPADVIVCQANTITGSIGVFGLLGNLQEFWKNKLGITWDRVKTGKYADIGNPNREMTEEEQQIIQSLIDKTYGEFKDRVATGRHLKPEFVDSIAQGHVYSGTQAKQLGLIDQIGNLDDAIALAAKKANLDKYSLRILPKYDAGIFKLFSHMEDEKISAMQKNLVKNYDLFKKVTEVQELNGVLMYYPYDVNIY
jgi:protease-4